MHIESGSAMSSHGVAIFDKNIFSLDVIKKAVYRLSGEAICDFSLDGDKIVCNIYPRQGSFEQNIEILVERVKTEVLDQDLRQRIADETAHIRNVILAHTFSRTGLQD